MTNKISIKKFVAGVLALLMVVTALPVNGLFGALSVKAADTLADTTDIAFGDGTSGKVVTEGSSKVVYLNLAGSASDVKATFTGSGSSAQKPMVVSSNTTVVTADAAALSSNDSTVTLTPVSTGTATITIYNVADGGDVADATEDASLIVKVINVSAVTPAAITVKQNTQTVLTASVYALAASEENATANTAAGAKDNIFVASDDNAKAKLVSVTNTTTGKTVKVGDSSCNQTAENNGILIPAAAGNNNLEITVEAAGTAAGNVKTTYMGLASTASAVTGKATSAGSGKTDEVNGIEFSTAIDKNGEVDYRKDGDDIYVDLVNKDVDTTDKEDRTMAAVSLDVSYLATTGTENKGVKLVVDTSDAAVANIGSAKGVMDIWKAGAAVSPDGEIIPKQVGSKWVATVYVEPNKAGVTKISINNGVVEDSDAKDEGKVYAEAVFYVQVSSVYGVTYSSGSASGTDVDIPEGTEYIVDPGTPAGGKKTGTSVGATYDAIVNASKDGSAFLGYRSTDSYTIEKANGSTSTLDAGAANSAADAAKYAVAGDKITGITGNLVLIAQWNDATKYRIVYNGNGNTSGNVPTEQVQTGTAQANPTGTQTETDAIEYGKLVKISKGTSLKKDGQIFVGWALTKDASKTNVLKDTTYDGTTGVLGDGTGAVGKVDVALIDKLITGKETLSGEYYNINLYAVYEDGISLTFTNDGDTAITITDGTTTSAVKDIVLAVDKGSTVLPAAVTASKIGYADTNLWSDGGDPYTDTTSLGNGTSDGKYLDVINKRGTAEDTTYVSLTASDYNAEITTSRTLEPYWNRYYVVTQTAKGKTIAKKTVVQADKSSTKGGAETRFTVPEGPEIDGLEFIGWSVGAYGTNSASGSNAWYFSKALDYNFEPDLSSPVAVGTNLLVPGDVIFGMDKDIVLKATYNEPVYTVDYNVMGKGQQVYDTVNGGDPTTNLPGTTGGVKTYIASGTNDGMTTVSGNSKIFVASAPKNDTKSKSSYFLGWTLSQELAGTITDASDENLVPGGASISVSDLAPLADEDNIIHFYAVWVDAVKVTYAVKDDADVTGASGYSLTADLLKSLGVTGTGYTKTDMDQDVADGLIEGYAFDKDVDPAAATVSDIASVTIKAQKDAPFRLTQLLPEDISGKVFKEWTADDTDSTTLPQGGTYENLSKDTTFTASFQNGISINLNLGTTYSDYDGELTAIETAIATGSIGSLTSHQKEIYTRWAVANAYNSANVPSAVTTSVNGDIVLPVAPVLPGYTFLGWTTNSTTANHVVEKASDAKTYLEYEAENTITSARKTLDGSEDLYAVWLKNTYKINYENLGTAKANNPGEYVHQGTAITLKSPSARSGYSFVCWTIDTNGDGIIDDNDGADLRQTSQATYDGTQEGAIEKILNTAVGDITLYAVWGLGFDSVDMKEDTFELQYGEILKQDSVRKLLTDNVRLRLGDGSEIKTTADEDWENYVEGVKWQVYNEDDELTTYDSKPEKTTTYTFKGVVDVNESVLGISGIDASRFKVTAKVTVLAEDESEEVLPENVSRNEDGSLSYEEEGLGKGDIPEEAVYGGVVYRLYNKNTGEHFYTVNPEEKDFDVQNGWTFEGEEYVSVPAKKELAKAVYRVYNPNATTGSHHFTMSYEETKWLVGLGWVFEGVSFYVYDKDGEMGEPVYREYNPNDGNHNYTKDIIEHKINVGLGWDDEGICWRADEY